MGVGSDTLAATDGAVEAVEVVQQRHPPLTHRASAELTQAGGISGSVGAVTIRNATIGLVRVGVVLALVGSPMWAAAAGAGDTPSMTADSLSGSPGTSISVHGTGCSQQAPDEVMSVIVQILRGASDPVDPTPLVLHEDESTLQVVPLADGTWNAAISISGAAVPGNPYRITGTCMAATDNVLGRRLTYTSIPITVTAPAADPVPEPPTFTG